MGKDKKKSKVKSCSFTEKSFCKTYESIFNTTKYSDVKIELNNETIPAHLLVLQNIFTIFIHWFC